MVDWKLMFETSIKCAAIKVKVDCVPDMNLYWTMEIPTNRCHLREVLLAKSKFYYFSFLLNFYGHLSWLLFVITFPLNHSFYVSIHCSSLNIKFLSFTRLEIYVWLNWFQNSEAPVMNTSHVYFAESPFEDHKHF